MKGTVIFHNIKIKDTKKAQVSFVYLHKGFAKRLQPEEIRKLKGKYVFFIIPQWLAIEKNFSSTKLHGKVTAVSTKGVRINFTEWFPISQIRELYILSKGKQDNLIKFMENELIKQEDNNNYFGEEYVST